MDRMNVVYQQRDGITLVFIDSFSSFLPFPHSFMVKLYEKKNLILDICEKVMLPDHVENIRSAKS